MYIDNLICFTITMIGTTESCHTPPAAEIPSLHKEAKYIVFISSLLNLISMCCWSVCGSRALQTRHKEVGSMLIVSLKC